MQELKQLEQEIFNCSKCQRLRSASLIPWPHVYYGKPEELNLMVVMRNPGLENNHIDVNKFIDDYEDLWLRCKIGKYLLQNVGKEIVMKKMFFCNICKCSSPSNSPLAVDEIANCNEYLRRQIDIIKPKLIMCFGNEAFNTLQSIDLYIPVEKFYHPSYISRGPRIISKQHS